MNCPKCKRGEIEPAGNCPVCGHGIVKSAQPAFLPFPANENILSFPAERVKKKIESSNPLRIVKEKPIPSWRLEVSQKVQQVLRARENKQGGAPLVETAAVAVAGASGGGGTICASPAPPVFRQSVAVVVEPSIADAVPCTSAPTRLAEASLAPPAPNPGARTHDTLPALFSTMLLDPPPVSAQRRAAPEPQVGVRLTSESMNETARALDTPSVQALVNATDFQMAYPPDVAPHQESFTRNKADQQGLLLSRTLSGLIDLITVLFSAIPFFFTLVYLLGYEEIDTFELSVLLGVCSALFLLYSVFFVTFSGQTIGMMITNLQVVDAHGELPSHGRAMKRVFAFLLALGIGGLGLLWGAVDRKKRCLHDLLSNTMVVRVDSAELP